ncbi:MAG: S9 family peptidase [Gemmatimonadetes bacterium]|nr:S9 family peptidase [Gemmatimonadota bacterium]
MIRTGPLAVLLVCLAPRLSAQVDYSRAERLLPWHTSRLVSGDSVRPQWYPDGNRFWYRNKTATGAEFVVVDPVRNTRARLFDNARLAAAMSIARDTAYDPDRLPFASFVFTDDGKNEREIEFAANRKRFVCDIGGYRCVVSDTLPSEVPFVLSPDKKWEAFIHHHNVWVRPRRGRDSIQLTSDGVEYWGYGLTMPSPGQLVRPQPRRPTIRWSPDSRTLAVWRQDERRVEHMHYLSSTPQRPKHYSQPYALPGDSIIPVPTLHLIDVGSKANREVRLSPQPAQLSVTGSAKDSAWADASDRVFVTGMSRGSKRTWLAAVSVATGEITTLAADSQPTFVEWSPPSGPPQWHVTRDGQDVFWWSERDGWAHFYRYGGDGRLKNRVTEGPWFAASIEYLDETAKQLYFTAKGREAGQFWYYSKLYRVGFDGSGLTLLTAEDAHHEIDFSPSGRFFVDSYSRIEAPTVTVLRSALDGRVLRPLEQADVTRLKEVGWRPGQVFSVKARDGVTDLYGVLYLPPGLDSTKRYPIIDHIYPGPQVGSVGAWSFKSGGEAFALAQLGFVVVQLDHLGTPWRSKAFHDSYYGNFIDNGLPDHVATLKQLGARYPFIDLDRIGIFGHSGGGFASTDAILRYPEIFKVAVSTSGNHDNRSYNIYWAEKYQGLMRRDSVRKTDNFEASANGSYAKNLKGRLFLMTGDMDDNVHPAMTIQVADALIKANRTFDFLILPNRAHSLNEPYVIRRRWDYFVEHLLGAVPPENYEIVRPTDPWASGPPTP